MEKYEENFTRSEKNGKIVNVSKQKDLPNVETNISGFVLYLQRANKCIY